MRVLFVACGRCGASNLSPFGLCPDCQDREAAIRAAAKRRIRVVQPVPSKRTAA